MILEAYLPPPLKTFIGQEKWRQKKKKKKAT